MDLQKRKKGPILISPNNHRRLKIFDGDDDVSINDEDCNEAGTTGQSRQDI